MIHYGTSWTPLRGTARDARIVGHRRPDSWPFDPFADGAVALQWRGSVWAGPPPAAPAHTLAPRRATTKGMTPHESRRPLPPPGRLAVLRRGRRRRTGPAAGPRQPRRGGVLREARPPRPGRALPVLPRRQEVPRRAAAGLARRAAQ